MRRDLLWLLAVVIGISLGALSTLPGKPGPLAEPPPLVKSCANPSPRPAPRTVQAIQEGVDLETVRRFMLSGTWSTVEGGFSMAPSSTISFSRDERYYLSHSPGACAVMVARPSQGTWELQQADGQVRISFDGHRPEVVQIDPARGRLYLRNKTWYHPRCGRQAPVSRPGTRGPG